MSKALSAYDFFDPEVIGAGVDALLEFPSDELQEDACNVVAAVFKAMTERQLALRL